MVWAKRTILALIFILLASPALAAIDRFTDNKGVLHLTNINPKKARIEERDQDFTSPSKRVSGSPGPVVKPSQETEPSESEDKEEPTKPSSYLTVRKGVIHISNVTDRQVEVARAQPATPRPAEPVPGGSHVAMEHPAAPVIPAAFASAPRAPASLPPVPGLPSGPINSYRDRQGVIRITNTPSSDLNRNTMVAGWSSQLPIGQVAEGDAGGNGHCETGTSLVKKVEAGTPPIKTVAFIAPEPDGALPVAALPVAKPPDPQAKGAVRRFRDAKGVVHIVGRGPAVGQPYQAPLTPTGRMIAGAGLPSSAAGGLHRTYPGRGLAGPPVPGLSEPTILVRKNSQGKVLIRNAPPAENLRNGKEDVRRRLEPFLVEAAYLFGLPVSLIEAVVQVESNFQTSAVSPKGAMGLMQLMPGTAKFLNVDDPFCPRENILGGCRYLRLLLDFFGQSLPLALAAYNAGFQRVIDAGFQVPDIKETQNFVTKVMGHYYLREKQRYFARRFTL